MGDQNRNISTFEKLAIGVGLGIGAFLGYKYMTSNEEPQRHQEIESDESNDEASASGGSSHSENIRVIENSEELRRSIRELNVYCSEFKVLGFDCEYEIINNTRTVVLLQLQTYQGLCLLIRLNKLATIPVELKRILENGQILKVGVDPIKDSEQLQRYYDVTVKGTLDLRYLAVQAGCKTGTLAFMSENHLNLKLKKGSDKALHFDWNKTPLSEKQINYAAKDARAAIELFKFFVEKLFRDRHSLSYFADKKTRVETITIDHCTKFVDRYYNGAQGIPREMIYNTD